MEHLTLNVIDDNYILEIFKDKNGNIIPAKTRESWLNKHEDIKSYLLNRYPNDKFISYSFIIKRIFNHIEELPKCQNCGKILYNIKGKWCSSKCQLTDEKFIKYRNSIINWNELGQKISKIISNFSQEKQEKIKQKRKETCIKKYGVDSVPKSELVKQKIKETNLKKYGVENVFQSEIHKQKIRKTKLERYGDEYFLNKEKTKQTIKEKYNIDNWMSSEVFKTKSKQTKLKKYGDENYLNIKKQKETCLKKWGVDNWRKSLDSINKTHSKEANKKRNETKRKNGTFNTSIPEKKSYECLKEIFPDVLYQYKSDVYPFACDFYIPSLDLYIECNYHWTHGKKPFEDNENDKLIIENWKAKNTQYYMNAINTWTKLDVKKRTIAKENKLNYLEFWDIKELKEWLNNTLQ